MNVFPISRPLFAAGFFLCANFALAGGLSMLDCQLVAPKPVHLGQPVMLGFQLANHGKAAVWVLDWNTPLEGLRNRFLKVQGEQGEVAYQGPMFKRGQPTLSQYRQIDPGQTIHAEIDLALAYAFPQPGKYQVSFTGRLHDVITAPAKPPRGQAAFKPQTLRCGSAELVLVPGA